MTRFRAVLFDAGNTLVEMDWEAVSRIFARHGVAREPAAIREAQARFRPELDAWLARETRSTETVDTRARILGLLFHRLGIGDAAARAGIAADLGRAMGDLWTRPAEGVAEALDALAASGRRLGVVSNSDGRIAEILAGIGVADRFGTIVDSGIEGIEKPDPAIFRIALGRLGAAAAETVYVGDLPSVDLAGARAAGLAGILIDPTGSFDGVGWPRIRRLPELPALLETS